MIFHDLFQMLFLLLVEWLSHEYVIILSVIQYQCLLLLPTINECLHRRSHYIVSPTVFPLLRQWRYPWRLNRAVLLPSHHTYNAVVYCVYRVSIRRCMILLIVIYIVWRHLVTKVRLRKRRLQLTATLNWWRVVVISADRLNCVLLVIQLLTLFVNKTIVLKLNLLIKYFPVTRPNTVRYGGDISGGISLLVQVIFIYEYFALGVILHPLISLILYHLLIVLKVRVISWVVDSFSIVLKDGYWCDGFWDQLELVCNWLGFFHLLLLRGLQIAIINWLIAEIKEIVFLFLNWIINRLTIQLEFIDFHHLLILILQHTNHLLPWA